LQRLVNNLETETICLISPCTFCGSNLALSTHRSSDSTEDSPLQLSRFHLFLALAAILVLRVTVGYHFFKEGTNKLKYGFDASGFLSSAKGPLADQFKTMVDDHDGKKRLGIKIDQSASGIGSVSVSPEQTLALWTDFRDQAAGLYRFGDPELVERLKTQRTKMAEDILTARTAGDAKKAQDLEQERKRAEQKIIKIRSQLPRAEEILNSASKELTDWISDNRVEIVAHYGTEDREEGFDRDGENKADAALYVDSLRYQVDTITSDRKKKLYGWYAAIGNMWDAYEGQINALATEDQIKAAGSAAPIVAARQFDQPFSALKVINLIIPWFDTIVGVLLILGLFTRLASGAAALFLVSVILTQPPWIPGTAVRHLCWQDWRAGFLFRRCRNKK